MKKLNTKTGFTLAELLIVVAIIAILVAIGIPAFSTAMERSRETVDLANIRGAYAEYMAGTLGGTADTGYYKITLKQRDCSDWIIDTAGFLSNIVDASGNALSEMPVGTNFQTGILWVKFTSVANSEKPTLSYEAHDSVEKMPTSIKDLDAYDPSSPGTGGVVAPLTSGSSGAAPEEDSDWYLTMENAGSTSGSSDGNSNNGDGNNNDGNG